MKYDYGSDMWRLYIGSAQSALAWSEFDSAEEAHEAEEKLKHRLVEAPDGDVVAILLGWADWVSPSLVALLGERCGGLK